MFKAIERTILRLLEPLLLTFVLIDRSRAPEPVTLDFEGDTVSGTAFLRHGRIYQVLLVVENPNYDFVALSYRDIPDSAVLLIDQAERTLDLRNNGFVEGGSRGPWKGGLVLADLAPEQNDRHISFKIIFPQEQLDRFRDHYGGTKLRVQECSF